MSTSRVGAQKTSYHSTQARQIRGTLTPRTISWSHRIGVANTTKTHSRRQADKLSSMIHLKVTNLEGRQLVWLLRLIKIGLWIKGRRWWSKIRGLGSSHPERVIEIPSAMTAKSTKKLLVAGLRHAKIRETKRIKEEQEKLPLIKILLLRRISFQTSEGILRSKQMKNHSLRRKGLCTSTTLRNSNTCARKMLKRGTLLVRSSAKAPSDLSVSALTMHRGASLQSK